MDFSANEMGVLVQLLEAVAGGAVTPNQAATAHGLAARFRDRQAPTPGADRGVHVLEETPAAPPRIDPAAIFAKRREQVVAAQAASAAARPRAGGN